MTEEVAAEAKAEQEKVLLQEQRLSNYMQQKNYVKAVGVAIALDQPLKVFTILQGFFVLFFFLVFPIAEFLLYNSNFKVAPECSTYQNKWCVSFKREVGVLGFVVVFQSFYYLERGWNLCQVCCVLLFLQNWLRSVVQMETLVALYAAWETRSSVSCEFVELILYSSSLLNRGSDLAVYHFIPNLYIRKDCKFQLSLKKVLQVDYPGRGREGLAS